MQNKETFSYTYSAKQQEEIKKIREKYLPKEADKMEQLRRLDESVTRKGTIVSLVVGIIGTLVMGFGMSCCMVWTDTMLILGIIVGVVGIAALSAAYPLYNYVTKKEREKIAPEIIRLSDELMK
ncbi:MAG: multidrug efflux MFS transporter [Ruminococcaceae bacterium]|nr:multidrug efflux MFS transporter [Oscillospiraceae bacterium]